MLDAVRPEPCGFGHPVKTTMRSRNGRPLCPAWRGVWSAIVLWNKVYLERAVHALRGHGHAVDPALS